MTLSAGRLTNPDIRCAGVSLNTAHLSAADAADLIATESARLNLHVADPLRDGPDFERLLDACAAA